MTASVLVLAHPGASFWALVLAVSLSALAGHAVLLGMHLLVHAQAIAKGRVRS